MSIIRCFIIRAYTKFALLPVAILSLPSSRSGSPVQSLVMRLKNFSANGTFPSSNYSRTRLPRPKFISKNCSTLMLFKVFKMFSGIATWPKKCILMGDSGFSILWLLCINYHCQNRAICRTPAVHPGHGEGVGDSRLHSRLH